MRHNGHSMIPTCTTDNKYEYARVVSHGTLTKNIKMSVLKLCVRFFHPNTRTFPTVT